MVAHRKRWWAWIALLPALLTTDVRAAETSVSLSLDYEIDGRAAPFLLPFDKGYYKAEGLNVAIEAASGSLETIERVASGSYEMGLADINALIKFRDTLRKQAATRAVPLPEGALDSAFRPERHVARLAPVFERLARLS